MKIDNITSINKISQIKKKSTINTSENNDVNFSALLNNDEVASSSFITVINNLTDMPLAFTGNNDKELLQKGEEILQLLDILKLNILEGKISKDNLHNIKNAINSKTQSFNNIKLQHILQEIEIRAAVEIAKIEVATRKLVEHS